MGICADPEEGEMQPCSNLPSVRGQGCSGRTSQGLAPMAMLLTFGCSVQLEGETLAGGAFARGWRVRDKEVLCSSLPSLCRL